MPEFPSDNALFGHPLPDHWLSVEIIRGNIDGEHLQAVLLIVRVKIDCNLSGARSIYRIDTLTGQ
jgi:hypothetical protein